MEDLNLVKKELQEQKQRLESELEQVAQKSGRGGNNYRVKFPEYGRAEDENADEVSAFVDGLSMKKNLRESLESVEIALKKIEKKKYGFCETCGKKINQKRLKILPTARYCLECKKSKR